MKKILFLINLFFAFQIANSQEIFTKNRTFIDIQTGASNIGATFGGGVHYGIAPSISVGANFYYQTFFQRSPYFSAFVPEISVDYHFGKLIKTDWYAGTSVGYCFWRSDDATNYNSCCVYPSYDNKHRRSVIYNAHIGVRYFVYKNIGLNAQIGVGNVFSGRTGISFKF